MILGVRAHASLTRRQLLRLTAAVSAMAALPSRVLGAFERAGAAEPASPQGFLSADEFAILDAATAQIIPTDNLPGAREIGAVDYIQTLLTFGPGADANCDRRVNAADIVAAERRAAGENGSCATGGDVNGDGVTDAADVDAARSAVFTARPHFAGGPFSGRNPQPHTVPTGGQACLSCHGARSGAQALGAGGAGTGVEDVYPPDFFRRHLPLTRLQEMSWKIRLLGAEAVPEAADNPLATESLEVDFRRKYRNGLAALESAAQAQFGMSFPRLSSDRQAQIMQATDQNFIHLLRLHTLEGLLSAPEYGGNRNMLGWQLVGFDGDSQPLGYAIYDETVPGNYRERPDKPNSTPNPDEDCSGFSEAMQLFLTVISGTAPVAPGARFDNPFCFEVGS